jgi:uncharacterized membrane protein HdeD (DUF308 family)
MLGALIIAILAILTAVGIILCARGVIPPNHVFGMRIATFLSSEDAWRIGHRAAIMPTAATAVASVVVVVVVGFVPALGETAAATLINTGLLALGVVTGAVRGSRAIARIGS